MYEIYKPLRNKVRQLYVWDALVVVYHYFQGMEFDRPIPEQIRPPVKITGSRLDKIKSGILPWEFELLCREIILNADTSKFGHGKIDYRKVADLINSIKDIENRTWGLHERRQDDILYELVRIAFRQFPWQRGAFLQQITTYYKIYSSPRLAELFYRVFGMDAKSMMQISQSLVGHFLETPLARVPFTNELNDVSGETLNRFAKSLSITLKDLRTATAKEQQYNLNWAYTFNPLRNKPMIYIDDQNVICPIPSLLFRRVLNEVYFDLVAHGDEFSKNFGPAFQDAVGDMLKEHALFAAKTVFAESKYGPKKLRKDSVDWIVEDQSAALFIECKAVRARHHKVMDLNERENMEGELDRLRGYLLQLYVTLADALAGNYEHWELSTKPIFPVLVTLEEWEAFGTKMEEAVIAPIAVALEGRGLDSSLVARFPPTICSIYALDVALTVSDKSNLHSVFAGKTEGEKQAWQLETYLANDFPAADKIRPSELFQDAANEIRVV